MHITFVCSGNTCRSPMAEVIARAMIAEKGMTWVTVGSAGTAAWPGAPASKGALRTAAGAGLDLEAHASELLTVEVLASSALVLCMESGHLARAREMEVAERSRHRSHLLSEVAGASGEVGDPFGGPDEVYQATFAELHGLVEALLARTEAEGGPRPMTDWEVAERTGLTIYAVLGDPVAHSLSPVIHNAAFRAAGRDAVYVARLVDADECGEVLRALALAGGGGNVTLPHKELVVPFLDRCTPAVSATGACNTFWEEDGEVWGDNTDVEGFIGSWRSALSGLENAMRDPPSVLVLGAGGAARAVLFGLLDSVAELRILLWNRTTRKAQRLVRYFDDPRVRIVSDWRTAAPDVVVNATSAGLYGSGMPIDLEGLAGGPLALIDLVYAREDTPLCRAAKDLSIAVTDGRDMLVRQAAASQLRWFGERPRLEVMRLALP